MAIAYTIRPYRASDESGLLDAWNEAMWADPIDATTWRTRYLLDPDFATETCPVAVDTDTGTVVGFALAFTRPTQGASDAWVVGFGVIPSHRRNGIGTALFHHLRLQWRRMGVRNVPIGPYIPSYVTPGVDKHAYPEAIALLQHLGADVGSRALSMKASLTGWRPNPAVADRTGALAAEGITIRTVAPPDILLLIEFLEAKFPHWRGDASSVLDSLHGADPRSCTMHIAEERGQIIGYAQSRHERFGPFGVNEDYRGRGVGAVLLSRTLHAMRSRGYQCAWFLWTSDRAAKLYRQHGFEEVRRFALMTLPVATREDDTHD